MTWTWKWKTVCHAARPHEFRRLIPSAARRSLARAARRLAAAAIERPSASEGERVAAEWIAASLRELGAEARIEVERAHGTFWWPLGILNALALAGAALGRTVGRLLAATAFATLVDDLDHRSR